MPPVRRSRFPGLEDRGRRALVEELARLRRESDLSQTQIAARMGTSQSAVARLESGDPAPLGLKQLGGYRLVAVAPIQGRDERSDAEQDSRGCPGKVRHRERIYRSVDTIALALRRSHILACERRSVRDEA